MLVETCLFSKWYYIRRLPETNGTEHNKQFTTISYRSDSNIIENIEENVVGNVYKMFKISPSKYKNLSLSNILPNTQTAYIHE